MCPRLMPDITTTIASVSSSTTTTTNTAKHSGVIVLHTRGKRSTEIRSGIVEVLLLKLMELIDVVWLLLLLEGVVKTSGRILGPQ